MVKQKKYTYDEAFTSSKEYFNNDEFAPKVFIDKYALQNESAEYLEPNPEFMHHRLTSEFIRVENKYINPMTYDDIFNLMDKFKYVIPQGSPMYGVANPFTKQSLGNCFVINSPVDSYGGIFKADQELVQLMKRRAGVGLDISLIRPKGLSTKNSAKTTDGIGVFMERFSNSCREVAQAGRRGALMLSISIEHPEIETFINIKQDKKKVTGANISIRVTDEFMEAVKNNELFTLKWPVGSSNPQVTKVIKAKDLWDKIIHNAWNSAEPGILFWSNVEKYSPADIYGKVDSAFMSKSTNPCQPGWATVLTPSGISTLDNINIGDTIWSGEQWTKVINKVNSGEKEVFAYRTRGGTFYGTSNHRVLSNGQKIEVDKAQSIDISYLKTSDGIIPEFTESLSSIMDGLVIGDGMVHKASNNKILLCIGENDSDYFKHPIQKLMIESRPGVSKYAWAIQTSITYEELIKTYNKKVPDRYKFGNFVSKIGFLKGLYSANGSIVANRVTLKTSSFQIIEDVQMMLSSVGIISYYTANKSHEIEFENGIYECKQNYDLNIGILESRKLFFELIGFIQQDKQKKLIQTLNYNGKTKKTYDILEKKLLNVETVYDITVDAPEHTYWSGGLHVSNCGEIPMGVDSCRLMVINLLPFVINPFTTDAYFDFDKYADVVIKAQRLMDDLIDLEIESIDGIIAKVESDPESDSIKMVELNLWKEFRRTCIAGRRTGLGITALGDCLAALNIIYGSDLAIEKTEEIYKNLAINAFKSSVILAKERGPFPFFSHELEKDHPFLQRIWDAAPEVYELYKKYGRRNIAITTTAPTGSVSALTQTTSGIEPAFMLSYIRRKKVNPDSKNIKIDFVDELGDAWQEYTVYHHGLKKWMDITGETDITKSPYYKATSADCNWQASVKMQGVAQKWICHAISKTVNIPKETLEEEVKAIYMTAWEEGCKGCTIYRDGCRTGVLISEDTYNKQKNDKEGRPIKIIPSLAPKRPKELPCEIHHATVKGIKWTVLVGLLQGEPYELFMGNAEDFTVPTKYKTGKIIKIGKGNYNFQIDDSDLIIKNIIKTSGDEDASWATRMISTSLRHGIAVEYLVEQLSKSGSIVDINNVLARILRKYLKEENKITKKELCPSCKEGELIYEEKCKRCLSCSWSGCG